MVATMAEFERMLKADGSLAQRYRQALEAVAADTSCTAKSDAEAVSMAAAAAGVEVSAEEVERELAAAQALSVPDLAVVAGGMLPTGAGATKVSEDEYGHDVGCIAAWHCYTALLHTGSDSGIEHCWSDYKCVFFSND